MSSPAITKFRDSIAVDEAAGTITATDARGRVQAQVACPSRARQCPPLHSALVSGNGTLVPAVGFDSSGGFLSRATGVAQARWPPGEATAAPLPGATRSSVCAGEEAGNCASGKTLARSLGAKLYALRGLKNTGRTSLRSVFQPISVRPLRWALSSMPLTFSKGLATPWSHHTGRDARIFIKNLTGRKMLVTVALDGSAFRLKQLLETTENVPVDDIRLVYSGKQLADDKPLEFYNIQAGASI